MVRRIDAGLLSCLRNHKLSFLAEQSTQIGTGWFTGGPRSLSSIFLSQSHGHATNLPNRICIRNSRHSGLRFDWRHDLSYQAAAWSTPFAHQRKEYTNPPNTAFRKFRARGRTCKRGSCTPQRQYVYIPHEGHTKRFSLVAAGARTLHKTPMAASQQQSRIQHWPFTAACGLSTIYSPPPFGIHTTLLRRSSVPSAAFLKEFKS